MGQGPGWWGESCLEPMLLGRRCFFMRFPPWFLHICCNGVHSFSRRPLPKLISSVTILSHHSKIIVIFQQEVLKCLQIDFQCVSEIRSAMATCWWMAPLWAWAFCWSVSRPRRPGRKLRPRPPRPRPPRPNPRRGPRSTWTLGMEAVEDLGVEIPNW